ncbi:hypothetical protein B4U79_05195, partial [Dinothrombium tinctorium]
LLFGVSFAVEDEIETTTSDGETTKNIGSTAPNFEPLAALIDKRGNLKDGNKYAKFVSIFVKKDQMKVNMPAVYDSQLPKTIRDKFLSIQDISFCSLMPDTGYWCDGAAGQGTYVVRYYYNRYSNKCRCFIYFGCDGNPNNFETVDECIKTCQASKFETLDDCDYIP